MKKDLESVYESMMGDLIRSQGEGLWGEYSDEENKRFLVRLCQEIHLLKDLGEWEEYLTIEENLSYTLGDDMLWESANSRTLNFDYLIYAPGHEKNSNLIDYFYKALRIGDLNHYLTPYSKEELAGMFLFKVKELNAGFAIKETEDRFGAPTRDIVAVHNNSDIKRIGGKLMTDAIKNDGQSLDHFDGFLSRLYEPLGFHGYHSDEWDDKYSPKGWPFKGIDVDNEKTFHTSRWDSYDDETKKKIIQRYRSGRPDVVYRSINKK